MKISLRLSIGFGILLVLLIALGGVGFRSSIESNKNTQDIIQQADIVHLSDACIANIKNAQVNSLRLIIYKNPEYFETMNNYFSNTLVTAAAITEKLESSELHTQALAITAAIKEYQIFANKWWELEQQKSAASKMRKEAGDQIRERATNLYNTALQSVSRQWGYRQHCPHQQTRQANHAPEAQLPGRIFLLYRR